MEQNDVWALALAERACELMAALGPGWELEEWTASWRRLHRVFPFEALTTELGREVATQLANALQVLQPFAAACAEGYVAPTLVTAAPGTGHRREHWRRARR